MPILAENKRAGRDYQVLQKFEAGLALEGHEVKAVRSGKMSLAGSYVVPRGNELFLVGASISPYQPANTPQGYLQDRSRKLLLRKKEIAHLIGKSREKGLTLLPLKVYTSGRRIKLEMAVVRGKRKSDKREKIKKRQTEREIGRLMRQW